MLLAALLAWALGDERFDHALALVNEQRFAEARPLLVAHVAEHPNDVTALAWLAYAEVSLADADAALATTERALELAPKLGPVWYHRGRALLLKHDFAAADAAFTNCSELAPDSFPAWRSHFQALAALGLRDEPRARVLYAASPESAQPWADPAFLFERMATLFPIVPEPEPARGWHRRAAKEYFVGEKVAAPLDVAPPVNGEWLVSQGNFGDESHFGIAGSFGFDLGLTKEGRLYLEAAVADGALTKEEFFTYGAPVRAPAKATIVRVVDGLAENGASLADQSPLLEPAVRWNPLGNHVVVKLADDAFLLLAHLRAGTITVKEGDVVAKDAELGQIGQSGVSYAPHLHLTALRSLDPPIGRPLRFTGCTVREPAGRVRRGDAVVPAAGELLIAR